MKFKELPTKLKVMWFGAILFIVLCITFVTDGITRYRKYTREHEKWSKSIQAPFVGRLFFFDRERPMCRVDSVMGDSVRITTIVHKRNVYKLPTNE